MRAPLNREQKGHAAAFLFSINPAAFFRGILSAFFFFWNKLRLRASCPILLFLNSPKKTGLPIPRRKALVLLLTALCCLFSYAHCSSTDEKYCGGDAGADPEIDALPQPALTDTSGDIVLPIEGIEETENYKYQYTCAYEKEEEIYWDDTSSANPGGSHTVEQGEVPASADNDDFVPAKGDLDKVCFYRARGCKGGSCGCWSETLSVLGGLSSPVYDSDLSDGIDDGLVLVLEGGLIVPTISGGIKSYRVNTFDFTLSWDDVVVDSTLGASSIERYEYTEDGGATVQDTGQDTDGAPITRFSVTTSSYAVYSYQVRTCGTINAISGCGPWSLPIHVEISRLPAPQGLMSDVTESTDGVYTISWGSVSGNVTRYQLQEKVEGTNIDPNDAAFADLDKHLAPSTVSYPITGRIGHGKYTYRVRACASDQDQDCGPWAQIMVTVKLEAPGSLMSDETATSTDGIYTVSWDSVSNADTYELQESKDDDGNWVTLQNTSDLSLMDITKDLDTEDGTYKYRIRSCKPSPGCGPWSAEITVIAGHFAGGEGTAAEPYQIADYVQVNNMRRDLSAHYVLTANIDASDSCGGNCSSPTGSGWVPVGDDANNFTGSLDGDGYTISNLYVNVSGSGAQYAGLFGYTNSNAEISNVSLNIVGISATATAADNARAGGLVGYNDGGTISNSYVTGDVSCTASSSGICSAGGLVGANTGGTISSSYATGDADASNTSATPYAGGLVGYNSGTISNSYATGDANAAISSSSNASVAGGLVGWNDGGTISNSYATGNASASAAASSYAGGLVGWNTGTISSSYATGGANAAPCGSSYYCPAGGLVGYNTGTISNSYATGDAASATNPIGGLLGNNDGGTISGTNYFVDSNGTNGIGSGSCASGATCDRKDLDWLRDTLNEQTALGWDNTIWDGLGSSGFPTLP